MEDVGHADIAHDTKSISTDIESSVNVALGEFSIRCLGIGVVEHSIYVLIPPGVLIFGRDIIPKFVLWTLASKTNILLEMM
jgi:hypothetical protein